MYKHCFICPTYGHYDYARAALESFFRHTAEAVAIVIDDAHPDYHRFWDSRWNIVHHRFSDRGGLTRSWNHGLLLARDLAEYTICSNDDVLFTSGWDSGPVALLEDPAAGIVGPLSNGPGRTNSRQNIWDHVPDYKASDAAEDLDRVSGYLHHHYKETDCQRVPILNGFFMIGKTARWWEAGFDERCVFNPALKFAMTENEVEFQQRLQNRGWNSLVSLRTYIFHYRSVTRGGKNKHGMWLRRNPQSAPQP